MAKQRSTELDHDKVRDVDNEHDVMRTARGQLDWYARRRDVSRILYQTTEFALLIATAATTVAAAISAPALATALLSAGTVFLTGFRQTFDPHGRWVVCSLAWMDARSAIWDYEFQGSHDVTARRALMSKLNQVAQAETSQWVTAQRLRRTSNGEPAGDQDEPETGEEPGALDVGTPDALDEPSSTPSATRPTPTRTGEDA